MSANVATGVGGLYANLSPYAFHMWAGHWLKACDDFVSPDRFSPVPYYLACRAIELELKARHLHARSRDQVRNAYWHSLIDPYNDLPADHRILTAPEVAVLAEASTIYDDKGFEYFDPEHALQGYGRFPDLSTLKVIARKLVEDGHKYGRIT